MITGVQAAVFYHLLQRICIESKIFLSLICNFTAFTSEGSKTRRTVCIKNEERKKSPNPQNLLIVLQVTNRHLLKVFNYIEAIKHASA